MKKLPFPKAVLFDFDGVIVDSLSCHHSAWEEAYLQIFGGQIVPFPEATHAGKAPIKIAEYFAEIGGDVSKASMLNALKQELLISGNIKPNLLPGVRKMRAFLLERKIPHGIASNAYTSFLKNTITGLSLGFEHYKGVDLFDAPKPSPIPYLTMANDLNISIEDRKQTLIFEDSLTGIQAARDSGMIPVGLTTQYTEQQLIENGAMYVYPTLLEAYLELLNTTEKER